MSPVRMPGRLPRTLVRMPGSRVKTPPTQLTMPESVSSKPPMSGMPGRLPDGAV